MSNSWYWEGIGRVKSLEIEYISKVLWNIAEGMDKSETPLNIPSESDTIQPIANWIFGEKEKGIEYEIWDKKHGLVDELLRIMITIRQVGFETTVTGEEKMITEL
jgi:hypothetical protein